MLYFNSAEQDATSTLQEVAKPNQKIVWNKI